MGLSIAAKSIQVSNLYGIFIIKSFNKLIGKSERQEKLTTKLNKKVFFEKQNLEMKQNELNEKLTLACTMTGTNMHSVEAEGYLAFASLSEVLFY